MSERLEVYRVKSDTHPDIICDRAADEYLNAVLKEHADKVSSADINAQLIGDRLLVFGYLRADLGFDPCKICEARIKEKFPFIKDVEDQVILRKGGTNFPTEESDINGIYAHAHSVYNMETGHKPECQHIIECLRDDFFERLNKVYENPFFDIRFVYDVEEGIVNHIETDINYTGYKNNKKSVPILSDVVRDLDISDELKKRVDPENDLYFYTRYNNEKIDSDGVIGRSRTKTDSGCYFYEIGPSGKLIKDHRRGPRLLAKYIANNIAATSNFDTVTTHIVFLKEAVSIFNKATMFGDAEVEFEFPEHFNQELKDLFPVTLDAIGDWIGDKDFNELLAEANQYWRRTDKVEEINNIKI